MIDRKDAEFILNALVESQLMFVTAYTAETNMVNKKILADIMDKNSRAIDRIRGVLLVL